MPHPMSNFEFQRRLQLAEALENIDVQDVGGGTVSHEEHCKVHVLGFCTCEPSVLVTTLDDEVLRLHPDGQVTKDH